MSRDMCLLLMVDGWEGKNGDLDLTFLEALGLDP